MLNLFEHNNSIKNIPVITSISLLIMMWFITTIVITNNNSKNNTIQKAYIIELKDNIGESEITSFKKELSENISIDANSIQFISKDNAFEKAKIKLDQAIINRVKEANIIKDVFSIELKPDISEYNYLIVSQII